MATTTISTKFQVVIPKEVRDKLHLSPQQRLQIVEKGGVITLVPEVPLKSLKGALKGMSRTGFREKKDRLCRECWIPAVGSNSSRADHSPNDMPPISPRGISSSRR